MLDNAEKSAATVRQPAFAFILVTLFLDMMSVGIVIPVLPKLVAGFLGGDTEHAARVYGLFVTVFALMQFLVAPIRGAISDQLGRRPLVLIANIGVALDYTLMSLAQSLTWIFVGRVIAGVTDGIVSISYAYSTDVTAPDKRAARFAILGAAIGAGFIFGPALGGYAATLAPRAPFWIAASLSVINAAYGFFILPESLPRSQRASFSWRRANPFGAFALLRSHRDLLGLAGVNFLINLSQTGLMSVGVLYMSYRYGWDEQTIGLAMAAFSFAGIIVQAGVVAPVTRRIGERGALLSGLGFGALGFLTIGLARSGAAFWFGIPWIALGALANPTLLALMSRSVNSSEQGLLQGTNSSIAGLAGLFGPILLSQSFAYAISSAHTWQLPGIPFWLAMTLMALAGVLAWKVTRRAAPTETALQSGL